MYSTEGWIILGFSYFTGLFVGLWCESALSIFSKSNYWMVHAFSQYPRSAAVWFVAFVLFSYFFFFRRCRWVVSALLCDRVCLDWVLLMENLWRGGNLPLHRLISTVVEALLWASLLSRPTLNTSASRSCRRDTLSPLPPRPMERSRPQTRPRWSQRPKMR